MANKGYDPKCYELAKYFLPTAKEHYVERLAQEIQDHIENVTAPHIHTCQQCDCVLESANGDGECNCDDPESMGWCSSNCRAAFDL